MRGDVLDRISVAGELRTAVRAEHLDIAYQPIVDLATGRVVAMEALARWTNEAGQTVLPDLFIPVAEETGLIGELGGLVLRDSTRQAAGWQDVGEIGVRVNARAHELRSRTYVDQVTACLRNVALPARLLGQEITESVFVDDDATTQENLTRPKQVGVTLLIDDLGTGYSSLSYLQRFRVVDVLKIDRSFLGRALGARQWSPPWWGWGGRSAWRCAPRASRPQSSTRACSSSGATSRRGTSGAARRPPRRCAR